MMICIEKDYNYCVLYYFTDEAKNVNAIVLQERFIVYYEHDYRLLSSIVRKETACS